MLPHAPHAWGCGARLKIVNRKSKIVNEYIFAGIMALDFQIDETWTLFLDRDGVINKKKDNDYVKSWDEFFFIEGSLKAISILSNIFKNIFIVTNQRGIGRGIMSDQDLDIIHNKMMNEIKYKKGRVDKIY